MKFRLLRLEQRAFTLIEVMVAIAILGLGLTVILSSQAGLYQSTRRVQNEAYAGNLLRCKMSEIELSLLREGFSLLDESDSGECCEGEDEEGFRCEWKIDTVELPSEDLFAESDEDNDAEGDFQDDVKETLESDPTADLDPSAFDGTTDPFSAIGALSGQGATAPGEFGSALAGATGGPGGIIQMALGIVYPSLKPMLEASIRKVTVSVIWNEGKRERDFTVTQFVTDPRQGGLNPNAAEVPEELLNGGSSKESDSDSKEGN